MNFLPPCPKPLVNTLAATATALVLAGCGGGGSNPPAANKAPVSSAGVAVSGKTGVAVTLDGNASSDADGDKLTFAWTLLTKPDGSNVSLTGTTSATPTFTPDVSGTYVASLVVSDGKLSSPPVTVTITVSPNKSAAFDSMPLPFPPNMPSFAFEATQTGSLGEKVTLKTGGPRLLDSIDVAMSSWACESGSWTGACVTTPGSSFSHPITVTLFDAGGTQIATKTQDFVVPYRPSPDPTCGSATQWKAANGNCYNGYAFKIDFDLRSLNVTLPETFTYVVSYNTSDYGTAPLHTPGGYDSLNVGLYDISVASPTVGTDADGGNGTLIVNGADSPEGYGIMATVNVTTP